MLTGVQGYQHDEAFDGLQGVEQFQSNPAGSFECVLSYLAISLE